MSKKVYRVLNTATGLYWNGKTSGVAVFSKDGHTFNNKASVERALSQYMRHGHYRLDIKLVRDVPSTWQLEELELVAKPTGSADLNSFSSNYRVRCALESMSYSYAYFFDTMSRKGVVDKIEFIIQLKGKKDNWGGTHVTKEQIMEARAQLRLLGVKTRTFREYRGMFGMMNREQAMRARLSLDVEQAIDLGKIRAEIAANVPVGIQHQVKI